MNKFQLKYLKNDSIMFHYVQKVIGSVFYKKRKLKMMEQSEEIKQVSMQTLIWLVLDMERISINSSCVYINTNNEHYKLGYLKQQL